MKLSWWIEGGEVIFRRGRRDRMDGPDGSACTWHLALCLYSSMDSTVSRTLPGLKRELEAFYSRSAMLMSWRAIRTVCQADLVRLHLIKNNSIFGRKCIWRWRWRWRCPWLLTMSGHCHPSAFDWSGAGQPNRDNGQWRIQQGQGT